MTAEEQRLAAKLRANRERNQVHDLFTDADTTWRGYHRQHEPRRWLAVCVVLFLVLMVLGCLPR